MLTLAIGLTRARRLTHLISHALPQDQFHLIEVNLLQKLEARVALSALLTRNAAVLLVPVLLAATAFFFYFLAMLGSPTAVTVGNVFDTFLGFVLRQGLPLAFALFVSLRVNALENVVALASLHKISKFLEYAPMKWMLTQKLSIDLGLISEIMRVLFVVFTLGSVLVATTVQVSTMPWDGKYSNYGSCADGIRSGHEQHIDCGGPESNCPLSCREKYGEYILIPADRDCTQVDGFVHITTQRACTAAYRTWARSNNRTTTVSNTEVYEDVRDMQALQEGWQQAGWSDGFRCGAFSMPRIDFGFETFNRVSFPALFSCWKNNKFGQEPYAYLCYHSAGSCKVRQSGEDNIHFEEMLSCPGKNAVFASAWRNISGPFPRLATNWRSDGHVATFHASVGSKGDCAEIEVLNSGQSGAQVVFALACNATDQVNQCRKSNNVKVTVEHYSSSIQSIIERTSKKIALVVSPIASMANATVYDLKIKSQDIVVKSGSTFFLVTDRSSGSMKIRLCV